MIIDSTVRNRIATLFEPLRNTPSASMPVRGFLSRSLRQQIDRVENGAIEFKITKTTRMAFASAAVDVWHRSAHSFLVSCSLTDASPVWASVAGYYSSHYAVRAMAHLLGYFQLYTYKRLIRIERVDLCSMTKKNAGDREHKLYWRVVKDSPQFAKDDWFTKNESSGEASDAGHRELANYWDHVSVLPPVRLLGADAIRDRADRISKISFSAPPIPRLSRFPDTESVQAMAYHRLVRVRRLMDECIESKNRFWTAHRQPSWLDGLLNFQLTDVSTPAEAVQT